MFYRSDWAEAGFSSPLQAGDGKGPSGQLLRKLRLSGAVFKWLIQESEFETGFYGFPVKELVLEIRGIGSEQGAKVSWSSEWRKLILRGTCCVMEDSSLKAGYVFSKVLREEPLHDALVRCEFKEVEQRKLYGCRFRDLRQSGDWKSSFEELDFLALEKLNALDPGEAREQVLGLCRSSFKNGYTRHFADSALREKKPGLDYILALMELNFRIVPPENILVAFDRERKSICGFSIIGRKPRIEGASYSQLLSAVSPDYRGRGVYRKLSFLAGEIFPPDALLLNVTHSDNLKIQRAYRGSGRMHIADTCILRRVFSGQSRSDGEKE